MRALPAAGLTELAVGVALFFATEGSSMVSSASDSAAVAVIAFSVLVAAVALARRYGASATTTSFVALIALVACALPSPADAFEIRRSEQTVMVPADEVIDDTLLAFGETVEISGTVNGDLIAFARRVVINGRVAGQVITGAQEIEIGAAIGGSVVGAAQTLTVSDSDIAHNLYAFGQTISTRNGVIRGNAALFGSRAVINAAVGRDAVGFGADVEVGGAVEGDVTAYAERVNVRDEARIGGDVIAHVQSEDNVSVASGATIGGELRTAVNGGQRGPGTERDDRSVGGWILAKVLRFTAAFIAGGLLLWLVPAVRRLSVDTPGEAFTAAGIGLITLISAPIVALLVAITIIGLPVAFVVFVLWVIGLYLAKIVVAHYVGRRLLITAGRNGHFTAPLALGLVIVLLVVSIPFIGGIVNFLLTITGLGLLAILLARVLPREPNDAAVAP